MLSLAGDEVKPTASADRKIDIEAKARREQQARQQREVAGDRLGAALSQFRRRNGAKRLVKSRY
jgi:hypothetical protein